MPSLLSSHRPGRKVVRAIAIVLASLSALAITAATTLSEKAKPDRVGRLAKEMAASAVSDVDGLAALFKAQQNVYLCMSPPDPDFLLRQPCGTVAFDPKLFPEDFMKGLIEETDRGCPVYTVVMAEDPTTRETVFANAKGAEIFAVRAGRNYSPWLLLDSLWPDLASGAYRTEEIEILRACHDPARVQIVARLLPVDYIEAYVTEIENESAFSSSGGGTVLMRYSGPPVTNLILTAIEAKTNGMLLTLAYPNTFTNRVDFFNCTDLADGWWDVAGTTNVNTSTNWIEWLATSPPVMRFYAAGNADTNSDTDPDGDGLTWAREVFMYHTNPTNSDSDFDGLSDYEEVINRHTDPNNSNTCLPTVSILFPANGSGKVWLP